MGRFFGRIKNSLEYYKVNQEKLSIISYSNYLIREKIVTIKKSPCTTFGSCDNEMDAESSVLNLTDMKRIRADKAKKKL